MKKARRLFYRHAHRFLAMAFAAPYVLLSIEPKQTAWASALLVAVIAAMALSVHWPRKPKKQGKPAAQVLEQILGIKPRPAPELDPPAPPPTPPLSPPVGWKWEVALWQVGMMLLVLPWLPNDVLPIRPAWIAAAAWAIILGSFHWSTRTLQSASPDSGLRMRRCMDEGDYSAVLATAPADSFAYRAEALLRLGKSSEAEAVLRESLLDGTSREWLTSYQCLMLARVEIEQEQFSAALRSLSAAVAIDGEERAPMAETRALCCLRQGVDPAQALAAARRAVKGNDERSRVVLAWALAVNRHSSQARREIKRWRPPQNSKPAAAEGHYYAGRALLVCGDRAAAAEHFRLASEAEPHAHFGHLSRQALAIRPR